MTTEATGTPEGQTPTTPAPEGQTPQTPANTPVVDPKLTDTPAQTPTTPAAPTAPAAVAYDQTGDVGLDMALDFVGKLGIAKDHPAMAATATGDFSLIKAHLAQMGDKARGWEQFVALAEQSYTRQTAAVAETAKQVSAAVVAVAGSQESWDAIKSWASQNATPEEKAGINAMFDAGPMQARAAAVMLKGLYEKAAGTIVNPKSAVRPDASSGANPTAGPLSRKDYAAEVRKLHAKLGNRMEGSAEYRALQQRANLRG